MYLLPMALLRRHIVSDQSQSHYDHHYPDSIRIKYCSRERLECLFSYHNEGRIEMERLSSWAQKSEKWGKDNREID